MIRKAAAVAILATYMGALIEVHVADDAREPVRWGRAPLSGAIVLGGAATLAWAAGQLRGETRP